MATAVPSRFAVLSLDDDDNKPKKSQKPTASVKVNVKNKSADKQKQQPRKDEKKKQTKSKKKKNNSEEQQWEQWKQKDSMVVEETYEQELHQAILLSKLTYEAQLENAAKTEKEQEQVKKATNKKSKKSTMSLEEFNNLDVNGTQNSVIKTENGDSRHKESNAEFFERVEKEVNQEIAKGKEKDTLKARLNQIDHNITSAQLKVEIEKRDEIIIKLKDEVESLKKELSEVKNRNKKLYSILAQGEMKDKAAVLAEVTKLQEIKDELASEVVLLHAQLEQERSKTRASSVDLKSTKQSNKKRLASENA